MSRRWLVWLFVLTTLSTVGHQEFRSEAAATTPLVYHLGDVLEVQIVGRDCRWEMTYPGYDRVLGTADDIVAGNRLHLPGGTTIRLHLCSADFVYSFALPERNLREIAVPDMSFTLLVSPLAPGHLTFHGGEMCGDRRNELSGTIVVQSPGEWIAWLHQIRSGHE